MSVTVKYKDSTIAELTNTGSKTLKTAGKYCEADIVVDHVKDAGPSISLPSSISKIDGGVFVLTSDTADFWISHALGVEPKGVMVWATTRPNCDRHNCLSSFQLCLSQVITGSAYVGYYIGNKLWSGQPNSESQLPGMITAAQKSAYIDGTTRFKWWTDGVYYEAGIEYKWLAWA